uniref:Neurokinin-A n=1 Tax=Gallus gallus TaxID=9031 RepID=TKNB_CHICK
HKTDSFVGLM